jgi:hypothetical protein
MILGQEFGPFLIDAQTVRLDRIKDLHAWLAQALLQLYNLPVKVQTGQCRLAALETEGTAAICKFHSSGNDSLHGLKGQHAFKAMFPMAGNITVEAVFAGHIAGRRRGFDQYKYWRHEESPSDISVIYYTAFFAGFLVHSPLLRKNSLRDML